MITLRYRAVLFDLDGTLVDSYAALADALNFARNGQGLPDLEPARVKSLVGDGIEKLLQRSFGVDVVAPEWRAVFEERYDAICVQQSFILEDVETTLDQLSRWGLAMAVCTNKPTAFSSKIIDALGIGHHFKGVVGPDLAEAHKPDRRHVLHALTFTGCSARETLFVGDMPIDIEGARNGGLDVAVVPSGSASAESLRQAGPDHFLDRFRDLVTLIGTATGEGAK